MKKIFVVVCLIIFCKNHLFAQAGAGMKLGPRHQNYIDSIKNSTYPSLFPIWGKKLSKRGFDLQYPYGFMLNTYIGSQQVNISDLKVGFNDMEPVPLDFIKFGEVKARIQSVTVRPDVWILPFADLYGIAGASWAQTDVNITEPFAFNTTANFNGSTVGLGTTLAFGYHGMIFLGDINHTWTKMNNIKGTIGTTMVTPRVGMNFLFKERPDRSIALWVGAPGVFINRTTEGTISVGDLKTNANKTDLEAAANGTPEWFQDLTPPQQAIVKAIAQKIIDKINGLDPGDATISYSLIKRPTSNWSMCAGGQFQLNHHWQFRTEFGFFGGRQSVLISGNYRWR
ncbi:MAG TPA: hypothetical protein VG890_11150 [Puia sp.]|nr:hypothetical protein [Puia sp.]